MRISVAGTTIIAPWFHSAGAVAANEEDTELLLPQVTDRIYVDLKAPTDLESRRIVIGLYGKAAPSSTRMLRQLVSPAGLPSKCKPRDTTRTLQKEQLEANKVYNSCIENEDKGVNYEYGNIWRIIKDERIDVGSVSGKYVAREFPNWAEDEANAGLPTLPMEFGTVSVLRGNESGFGFSIYPGKNIKTDVGDAIVIGKVLEGLDVIEQLNSFPVVKSSNVNYMALTGSDGMKKAPSRACSYGSSNLYCNEFKPLQKLSITATGVL
ncbi:peptidyl-prolyl cis-trans isomerase [Fragilaria crotonensis]|nr:peptidyl-prolyl cis-trans isomerase [Fragilaria crotonensis]